MVADGVAEHVDRGRRTSRRPGPTDRHFVWDSATGVVRFGPPIRYPDGSVRQHGAIPRDGADIAVTGYRYGGGARGNVGARTLTALRSAVPYRRVGRQPRPGHAAGSTPRRSPRPRSADR